MASNQRRIFIITGMSGAGKSQALKIFGDFGFIAWTICLSPYSKTLPTI